MGLRLLVGREGERERDLGSYRPVASAAVNLVLASILVGVLHGHYIHSHISILIQSRLTNSYLGKLTSTANPHRARHRNRHLRALHRPARNLIDETNSTLRRGSALLSVAAVSLRISRAHSSVDGILRSGVVVEFSIFEIVDTGVFVVVFVNVVAVVFFVGSAGTGVGNGEGRTEESREGEEGGELGELHFEVEEGFFGGD